MALVGDLSTQHILVTGKLSVAVSPNEPQIRLMAKPRTLYDKIFDDHVVDRQDDGTCLIYIDRHLVHEVTSPQAFEGLRAGRPQGPRAGEDARRRRSQCADDRSFARDHDPESRIQVEQLATNARDFGIDYFDAADRAPGHRPHHRPRTGFHSARHDHRLRRQPHLDAWRLRRARAWHRHLRGRACARDPDADPGEGEEHADQSSMAGSGEGVSAKDIVLAIIGEIGTAGGTGHVIEYAGEAIRGLSMEGRMTVCNMSIEAGARAGLIAPDEKTYAYLAGRPRAPKGAAWDAARRHWDTLHSEDGVEFDKEIRLDAANLPPLVTWGTSPEDVIAITGTVPRPEMAPSEAKRASIIRALDYMGLSGGEKITDIAIDRVFIGSCTNGRIEDLRDRGQDGGRQKGRGPRQCDGGAGLRPRQGAGGSRRSRQNLQSSGLRMARTRLLDVPCHESRQALPRRALRLDLEPQFRGPPRL